VIPLGGTIGRPNLNEYVGILCESVYLVKKKKRSYAFLFFLVILKTCLTQRDALEFVLKFEAKRLFSAGCTRVKKKSKIVANRIRICFGT
jgi:hypothetical protein